MIPADISTIVTTVRENKGYSYQTYADILDEILKTLIEKEIGLSTTAPALNTDSAAQPHEDILLRYRELGGELLTLGSDGHAPEHMAYDFLKTGELLKA